MFYAMVEQRGLLFAVTLVVEYISNALFANVENKANYLQRVHKCGASLDNIVFIEFGGSGIFVEL